MPTASIVNYRPREIRANATIVRRRDRWCGRPLRPERRAVDRRRHRLVRRVGGDIRRTLRADHAGAGDRHARSATRHAAARRRDDQRPAPAVSAGRRRRSGAHGDVDRVAGLRLLHRVPGRHGPPVDVDDQRRRTRPDPRRRRDRRRHRVRSRRVLARRRPRRSSTSRAGSPAPAKPVDDDGLFVAEQAPRRLLDTRGGDPVWAAGGGRDRQRRPERRGVGAQRHDRQPDPAGVPHRLPGAPGPAVDEHRQRRRALGHRRGDGDRADLADGCRRLLERRRRRRGRRVGMVRRHARAGAAAATDQRAAAGLHHLDRSVRPQRVLRERPGAGRRRLPARVRTAGRHGCCGSSRTSSSAAATARRRSPTTPASCRAGRASRCCESGNYASPGEYLFPDMHAAPPALVLAAVGRHGRRRPIPSVRRRDARERPDLPVVHGADRDLGGDDRPGDRCRSSIAARRPTRRPRCTGSRSSRTTTTRTCSPTAIASSVGTPFPFVDPPVYVHDWDCADRMTVARIPKGQFDQPLAYWNGSTWGADAAAAVNIVPPATASSTPVRCTCVNGKWVAITKVGDWFGTKIEIDVADQPQGPYTNVRTIATPAKCDGCNTYFASLLPYRGQRRLDADRHLEQRVRADRHEPLPPDVLRDASRSVHGVAVG